VAPVRPFAFYRDGLFWLACTAYSANRWLVKPHVSSAFVRGHLNDVWLIPCALPLVLWLHERCGLRTEGPPRLAEIAGHVAGWSVPFEWIGPRYLPWTTADAWDVVWYGVGATLGWVWWQRVSRAERKPLGFDALAPHYRWLEAVLAGPLLQRCRTRHIEALSESRDVLVLGPGRGRFVRRLLDTAPRARLTLVDSSLEMLRRVERDLQAAGVESARVRFVHADIRTWIPERPAFDAIASHFFLDCFAAEELAAIVRRVADWSAPGALWVVSDFRVPDRGWRRRRAQAIHALMYTAFRYVTRISARAVSPPDASLSRAGFALVSRHVSNQGLLHADLWRLAPADGCGSTLLR